MCQQGQQGAFQCILLNDIGKTVFLNQQLLFRSSWARESFSIHLDLVLRNQNHFWSLMLLLLPLTGQYLQILQDVRMVFVLSTILLHSTHSTLDVFALGDLGSCHLKEVYRWKYYLSIISTHRQCFLFLSVKQIS